MEVIFNGMAETIHESMTLAAFMREKSLTLSEIIIEYNGEVMLPGSDFESLMLKNGDVVNGFHVVAGG